MSSLRFVLLLLLAASAHAAEPTRVLVAIGHNLGDPTDAPLAWAEADAQRVASLFVELGDVAPERALVVLGQGADVVREKLAEARGRVEELAAEGREVVLIVYVSSHARAGELHLGGTRLPLDALRGFLQSAPARLKLGIVDACDSGVLVRKKGGAPAPDFEVSLTSAGVRGLALLSSSGPAEASQELSVLKGGLFTHHLLTGLRGDADADRDGAVTLAEVYGYSFRRTVEGAARGGQHPTFDLDLSGAGEFSLAAPKRGRSVIVFPDDAEGNFILSSQPRPDVVAEVNKVRGQPLSLAVPPGRYLVQKRLGLKVGLASLELPFGGRRTVEERALEVRGFGEVALKGGYLDVRPWALLAQGALGNEPLLATGLDWRAGVGLRRGFDAWWAGVSLLGSHRQYRGEQLSVAESSGTLRLDAGYRWLEWPVVPLVGVVADARLLSQVVRRDAEETLRLIYGGSVPPVTTVGFAAGPTVGAEVSLGERVFVQARVLGLLRWLPALNQPAFTFGVEGALGAGVRF
ncbi:MAG: caspase family protein [Archangium sp.]|nr:caspase family protein [Archangium sp.]